MKLFWLGIYNLIFYPIFFIVAVLLSPINYKIRTGLLGRWHSLKKLKDFKDMNPSLDIYWFHVSSFGEFQQIESIISSIKNSDNNIGIIVSFFSPSGYNNVNNDNIDCKVYLPFDFPWSIFRGLKLIKPKKIIFASYDIWPNLLLAARFLHIDTILISARIHNDSFKLRALGKSIYKAIYGLIDQIFTVNSRDLKNMELIVPDKVIKAMGNPRFDIVLTRESNVDIKFDRDYKLKNKLFLFASLWPEDDSMLFPRIFDLLKDNHNAKIILIPHELSDKSINYYQKQASRKNLSSIVIEDYIDLSSLKEQIIIINTVGILYKLYWQAHISYIGGGFSKNGIHNIMEPAVASNPIIFGPNYSNGNFSEAEELLSTSAAFTINSDSELIEVFNKLNDVNMHALSSTSARSVMESNIGSTSKLLSSILK